MMPITIGKLKFIVSHPLDVFSYLQRDKSIAKLLRCDRSSVKKILKEKKLKDIEKYVVSELGEYRRLTLGPSSKPRKPQVYYAVVRLLKPDVVVETGVQGGISSAYILQALHENGRGMLYSIDLPDAEILKVIPPEKRRGLESGWLVPENLRTRWHLILGDAREKLPSLLQELGQIDIFIHDSEHSYHHMLWEYRIAWRYLRSGGILLSDDTNLNDAFYDFAKERRVKPVRLIGPLAGLRKPSDSDS